MYTRCLGALRQLVVTTLYVLYSLVLSMDVFVPPCAIVRIDDIFINVTNYALENNIFPFI